VGFGDISASVALGPGAWSTPQNLTQTPTTDERFFSLAERNPNGDAHVLFQASATDQAGVAIIGDRGPSAPNILRRIAYLERPLSGSLVAVGDSPRGPKSVMRLRSWPNPARQRVSFVLEGGTAPGGAISILSADGREVASVPLTSANAATWDGRDVSGRAAPAGIYFARVRGASSSTSTRFLFIR
jgi:hypothetical protein